MSPVVLDGGTLSLAVGVPMLMGEGGGDNLRLPGELMPKMAFCSSSVSCTHFFFEESYARDGLLSVLPILVGVVVTNPSSFVCILNVPFAYGGGIILIRAGFLSLSMACIFEFIVMICL